MLTASGLSKSYGGRTLFEDASLQDQPRRQDRSDRGQRRRQVNPLLPDPEGSLSRRGNRGPREERHGGVPAPRKRPSGNETVLELATAVSAEMARVQRAMRELPDEDPERHEAVARHAELAGHALEVKARRIAGLAFRPADVEKPARTLSGGWIMRAHLARLLVMEPDLLMLDEPTNHLDLDSWAGSRTISSNTEAPSSRSRTTAPSSTPSAGASLRSATGN